jgi:hypothetical protein
MSKDWRDGFLFVGNQLSLDFLNTRPVIDGKPVELLPDSASLLRWLVATGLLTKRRAAQLVPPKDLDCQSYGISRDMAASCFSWRRVGCLRRPSSTG